MYGTLFEWIGYPPQEMLHFKGFDKLWKNNPCNCRGRDRGLVAPNGTPNVVGTMLVLTDTVSVERITSPTESG